MAFRWASAFLHDDSGQEMVEYVLVAALVGLSCVASARGAGTAVGTVFAAIGSTLSSAL